MMSRVLPLALAMVVWLGAAAFASRAADPALPTINWECDDSITCRFHGGVLLTVWETSPAGGVNVCNWGWQSNSYYQLPAATFIDQAAWAERQPKPPIPPPAIHGPLADWVALAALGRPASGGPGTLSHTLTLIVLGTIIVLISAFLIVEKYYLRSRHDQGCARD